MYFVLISILAGAITGFVAHKAAGQMIMMRNTESGKRFPIIESRMAAVWSIFYALLFFTLAMINQQTNLKGIEQMVLFSLFILIAATDSMVKKIPNELLLFLLIAKFAFILMSSEHWNYFGSLLGFAAALILFLLPSFLHINIGMGDIKYAGVLGFLFGAAAFLQIIFIMSLTMGIYAIILYIRKTGTVKTSVPVGPFLSLGAIITGVFPLITLL